MSATILSEIHVVVTGDSWESLAQYYETSPEHLRACNWQFTHLPNVFPGMVLSLPTRERVDEL